MDERRKRADPELVCTCNDLYLADMAQALEAGETAYKDIFMYHDMSPRCCGCVDHVMALAKRWQLGEPIR